MSLVVFSRQIKNFDCNVVCLVNFGSYIDWSSDISLSYRDVCEF